MSNRRGQGGQFLSQTAERTIIDEHQRSTVAELADGSKLLSAAPNVEELEDGSILITAPTDPSVREVVPLAEPVIFTHPTQPNVVLAGSLYKTGPGEWRKFPVNRKHYLRFVNGHCAARTEQAAAKILKHFPTIGGNQKVWREPAPLLSEAKAIERGLEPPFLFEDGSGKVLFWTYHRDALRAFTRTYHAHQG